MYDVYIGPLGLSVRNLSNYTGSERQNFWNDNCDEGYLDIPFAAALSWSSRAA
jgi:hypothetical protein